MWENIYTTYAIGFISGTATLTGDGSEFAEASVKPPSASTPGKGLHASTRRYIPEHVKKGSNGKQHVFSETLFLLFFIGIEQKKGFLGQTVPRKLPVKLNCSLLGALAAYFALRVSEGS